MTTTLIILAIILAAFPSWVLAGQHPHHIDLYHYDFTFNETRYYRATTVNGVVETVSVEGPPLPPMETLELAIVGDSTSTVWTRDHGTIVPGPSDSLEVLVSNYQTFSGSWIKASTKAEWTNLAPDSLPPRPLPTEPPLGGHPFHMLLGRIAPRYRIPGQVPTRTIWVSMPSPAPVTDLASTVTTFHA